MDIRKRAQILFDVAFDAQQDVFGYFENLHKLGIHVLDDKNVMDIKLLIQKANASYGALHEYLITKGASIVFRLEEGWAYHEKPFDINEERKRIANTENGNCVYRDIFSV